MRRYVRTTWQYIVVMYGLKDKWTSTNDLQLTTGTVSVFDKFRTADGKRCEICPFYDLALLNEAVEGMGAA